MKKLVGDTIRGAHIAIVTSLAMITVFALIISFAPNIYGTFCARGPFIGAQSFTVFVLCNAMRATGSATAWIFSNVVLQKRVHFSFSLQTSDPGFRFQMSTGEE